MRLLRTGETAAAFTFFSSSLSSEEEEEAARWSSGALANEREGYKDEESVLAKRVRLAVFRSGKYEGDVGEYEGDVGEYEGDVGEYEGENGEYSGDMGEYSGDMGEYCGDCGTDPSDDEKVGDVGEYDGSPDSVVISNAGASTALVSAALTRRSTLHPSPKVMRMRSPAFIFPTVIALCIGFTAMRDHNVWASSSAVWFGKDRGVDFNIGGCVA